MSSNILIQLQLLSTHGLSHFFCTYIYPPFIILKEFPNIIYFIHKYFNVISERYQLFKKLKIPLSYP